MYGQTASPKSLDSNPDPMGPVVIKSFDYNIERAHGFISRIEDQLHNILNLRHPVAEGKSETPMENDLNSALSNRLNTFSTLSNRLEAIVGHLDKIVG